MQRAFAYSVEFSIKQSDPLVFVYMEKRFTFHGFFKNLVAQQHSTQLFYAMVSKYARNSAQNMFEAMGAAFANYLGSQTQCMLMSFAQGTVMGFKALEYERIFVQYKGKVAEIGM